MNDCISFRTAVTPRSAAKLSQIGSDKLTLDEIYQEATVSTAVQEPRREFSTDTARYEVTPLRQSQTKIVPSFATWVLKVSQLPFLIMWAYFVFFFCVIILSQGYKEVMVWANGAVAGLLVGISLNANAYRGFYFGNKTLDVGMIMRFFLIPFGVTALSTLSNIKPNEFFFFFMIDFVKLSISIVIPGFIVSFLLLSRIYCINKYGFQLNLKSLFINNSIIPVPIY